MLTQTEYKTSAQGLSALVAPGTPIESVSYVYNNDSQILSSTQSGIQSGTSLTNSVTTTTYNYGTAAAVGIGPDAVAAETRAKADATQGVNAPCISRRSKCAGHYRNALESTPTTASL